tara:strand:- start:213 stop:782 length:570 start_codon:yes stop_codon:yes gene_type:complete
MKISKVFIILYLLSFNALNSSEINLSKNYLTIKDFLILKFELFLNNNIKNLFKGAGITNIAYQNIDYTVKIDDKDNIEINLDAIMDNQRYKAKKYSPKITDCNQVRNKIFLNKYGYSFLTQKYNNLVNENSLTENLNKTIFNISSIDNNLKDQILEKTRIKINIIHPKVVNNLSCSGRLIDNELELIVN